MRRDAMRRALLLRLFHLGRDSLSKLRKSITIFLARVSYHTIYGTSRLQRTHTPIPSASLSLSLPLSHIPLRCFARWTRNIISVHTKMVSRGAFRPSESPGSIWSFRKLRTMSFRAPAWSIEPASFPKRCPVNESQNVSETRDILFRGGVDREMSRIGARGEMGSTGARQAEITVV